MAVLLRGPIHGDLVQLKFTGDLSDLHYYYSEFFFWKVAYLHVIYLIFWGFILSHLGFILINFHFD